MSNKISASGLHNQAAADHQVAADGHKKAAESHAINQRINFRR
ncbi:hypothetical protein [Undibacterium sp.]